MKNSPAAFNKRLADRMMADGKLSPEAHAAVISHVGVHGGRVEDAIIDTGLMSEADLLRYLSTMFATRFVSTEKLYKANIDPGILALVPRKLADQHQVLPVMYEDAGRVLSVVTPNPHDLAVLTEVQIAASVREVAALVARPAAIHAAIQRAYHNDASVFASLMRPVSTQLAVDRFQSHSAPTGQGLAAVMALSVSHERPEPRREAPVARSGGVAALEHAADTQAAAPPRPPPAAAERGRAAQAPVALSQEYVETLNVLVSLLENSRPELRGHSALTARLVRKTCDRMGLGAAQTTAYIVAAYLHDIGKAGTYHLTALNVAEYDGHRSAAHKVYNVPDRFLQAVQLPSDTKSAISSMYERVDGKGFPLGLVGKEIPLGGRILAVADTYADLTQNPKNPARKVLSAREAMQFLEKYRDAVFDPTVLDIFRAELAGDDLRAKILADRHTVLLVDQDPEDTTVLELKLLEAGFDVKIARTLQQALHELRAHEVSIVISEVDLDVKDAGLALRTAAAAEPAGQRVLVWVIHTSKTDRQIAEIVFDLGVDDLVSKPAPPDVFVTKIRQLVERKRAKGATPAARGVSGSLAEMSLPDVVQILWHGRKSGTIRLKTPTGAGDISFIEGQVVDARLPPHRGEEAFYRMLTMKEGDFQIDPSALTKERTIDQSVEGLLLEGMRRLDEGTIS